MAWEWKYFTEEEMKCKCGCGGLPKDELMARLDEIRRRIDHPLIVSSGYRCPTYNALVSDTGSDGPHTLGLAVDIAISGGLAFKLVFLAIECGMTGIGVRQKGNSRFIHLDCVPLDSGYPRPTIWSY